MVGAPAETIQASSDLPRVTSAEPSIDFRIQPNQLEKPGAALDRSAVGRRRIRGLKEDRDPGIP